jgi:hypothetical protein
LVVKAIDVREIIPKRSPSYRIEPSLMWTVFLSLGDYHIRRIIMDETSKNGSGDVTEDWVDPHGLSREMAIKAEKIARKFPGIIVRSWNLFRGLKDGKDTQGVILNLTGPECEVHAFLAYVGLVCNLDCVRISQPIDPETGRTFSKLIKDFEGCLWL